MANNYITSNLFDGLNTKLITNMAGLEYIKAALVDGDTVVKGGLILSTLIALRNDKGNVTAGINGADTKENGIALWLGGKAIDKQASTTTEEEKKIAAKSLLRFDGTGYFANGNLWWDADGILHADPTSFIINKNNVGVQLALFAPVWKSGTTDTTKLANVLSIDPQKPFTHLDVSGNVTTEGSLKLVESIYRMIVPTMPFDYPRTLLERKQLTSMLLVVLPHTEQEHLPRVVAA